MDADSQIYSNELGLQSLLTTRAAEAIRAAAYAGLRALPGRGAEIGGLLTGPAENDSKDGSGQIIDVIELIPSEYRHGPSYQPFPADLALFRAKIEEIHASAQRKILGYFRSCTGDQFTVAPRDMRALREILPECRFVLIAKPFRDGHSSVRVFQADEGGTWSRSAEFELSGEFSGLVPPANEAASAPAMSAPLSSPVPVLPSTLTSKVRWPLWAAVSLAAVAVSLMWGYLRVASSVRSRTALAHSSSDLGMRVDPEGNTLRVSWNPRSQAVQSASEGTLQIDDGLQHRVLNLNSSEIRQCSILYKAGSEDLTFRLELRGSQGSTRWESVRVLERSKSDHRSDLASKTRPNRLDMSAPTPTAQLRSARELDRTAGPKSPRNASLQKSLDPISRSANPSRVATRLPVEAKVSAPPAPMPHVTVPSTPPFMGPRAPGKTSSQLASRGIRQPAPQLMRQSRPASSSSRKRSGDATNASWAKTSNTIAKPLPLARPPADSARTKGPDVLSVRNYVAPHPLRQITPNTKLVEPDVISGVTRIEVDVRINELGHVTQARAVENGTKNDALTTVAVSAAREWVFEPAKMDGRSVPSDYAIVFRFHPSGQ